MYSIVVHLWWGCGHNKWEVANEDNEGRRERRKLIEPIGTKYTQTPDIVAYIPLVRITVEDRVVLREGSTRSSPWLGTIDSGPPGRGYKKAVWSPQIFLHTP